MAEDWEDWETADLDAKLANVQPTTTKPNEPKFETKGEAILAQINGPDMTKFADEDKDFDASGPTHAVPASQPKKKEEKKYKDPSLPIDTPLDDPVLEKLRQQKLVEQADYEAARELFGGTLKPLDSYLPKTVKEFEDFANEIVSRHVLVHRESKHYKAFVKALVKGMLEPIPSEEVKDVETCVAGVRTDKVKAEKAKAAEKKGKKTLNLGKSGVSAGLDEYMYEDDYADGDDFM